MSPTFLFSFDLFFQMLEINFLLGRTGKELEKLALEVGFSNVIYYEIGGGFMGNLVATR